MRVSAALDGLSSTSGQAGPGVATRRPAGFPDADLYQVLAYCAALNLQRGHLVYARGNEQPARYLVRNCDIEIVCHAVDLSQPSATLLAQIRRIVSEIVQPYHHPPVTNLHRNGHRP